MPPEAAWPAQGQQQQGGARSSHQADEWRAEAAPAPQPTAGRHRHSTVLLVDQVDLYDAPRFRYRGLLLDTARHFLPVSVLKVGAGRLLGGQGSTPSRLIVCCLPSCPS